MDRPDISLANKCLMGANHSLQQGLEKTIAYFKTRIRMSVVIVTGGAGYMGSHTAKALNLAASRRYSGQSLPAAMMGRLHGARSKGLIADQAGLESVFKRHRPAPSCTFAACLCWRVRY